MSFLSAFTVWQFALAGAICAAGPILIHMLNRRRYKVVNWAAMDFLREALQRNRRMLQIRDIILLVLRTLAVLLFGLAVARPVISFLGMLGLAGSSLLALVGIGSGEAFDPRKQAELVDNQAVHAILLVDNSLSMGYADPDNPALDLLARAKDRLRGVIDRFPAGSKFSVIPVCGSREGYSPDPYSTKASALAALDKIQLVDRTATIQKAAAEALRAIASPTELSKRILFVTDQQASNWRDSLSQDALQKLPEMQVIDISPALRENTWIADFKLQDGVADVDTPTKFVVQIQSQIGASRRDVPVRIYMGDTVIGEKLIQLEPSGQDIQTREVDFEYTFSALPELPQPGKPVYVPLKATVAADYLPQDDERYLVAPVVAALPVVFVDQYGEDEDVIKNRLGETRHLRTLLAPRTSRTDKSLQLVRIKHHRIEEVTESILADARLVVIAGVPSIDESQVDLLREYVQQGGQLMIAAGAAFDAESWMNTAWKEGNGILPAPLKLQPIGEIPEVAGDQLKTFFISFDSLAGEDFFQLAGVETKELQDLYSEPIFFKAVDTDLADETIRTWQTAEQKRLEEQVDFLSQVGGRSSELALKEAKGSLSAEEQKQAQEDTARLKQLQPQWLTWAESQVGQQDDLQAIAQTKDAPLLQQQIASLVQGNSPRVLARLDNPERTPWLVERKIGRGNVMWVSSGLLSSWNTLPKTNAVLIFDRLLRSMTQATLPAPSMAAKDKFIIPLPSEDHYAAITLSRPGESVVTEPLDIGFIGNDRRGVTIPAMYERGVYRVSAYRREPTAKEEANEDPTLLKPTWEMKLAINGEADESQLGTLSTDNRDRLAASPNIRLIQAGDDVSLAGSTLGGHHRWWYLVLAVLVMLLLEMSVLAWPHVRAGETA